MVRDRLAGSEQHGLETRLLQQVPLDLQDQPLHLLEIVKVFRQGRLGPGALVTSGY